MKGPRSIGRGFPSGALFASLCLLAEAVPAQTGTGNLYGTVGDEQGNPLSGVTITISGGQAPLQQTSDAQGQFRFLGLYPTVYRLDATLEGFSPLEYAEVTVNSGRNVTLELELQAAIEEAITILAESPLLDQRRISTTAVVDRNELERIPTARDPWVILQTTPGVQVDRVNVGGNQSGQQSAYVGNGDSANTTWSIDGVEITDVGALGSSPGYHDFDAFEEMQVTTGGPDATLRTGGVGMNMVTRRGTNEWRGSARYLLADEQWQSSTGFDESDLAPGQPPFKAGNRIVDVEDLGAELGGPAWPDHLWLWAAYGEQNIRLLSQIDTPDDTTLETWNGKLNWQIVPENSFTISFWNNDKIKIGRDAGPTRPPETTYDQAGYAHEPELALFGWLTSKRPSLAKLEDTQIFGSNLFLTGIYAELDGGFSLTPQGGVGEDHVISVRDIDRVWHHTINEYFSDRPSEQYRLDGSYFAATGAVNHELKFGASARDSTVRSVSRWPGYGLAVSAGEPGLYIGLIGVDTEVAYEAEWRNWYLQDTLTWASFTLNLGVRNDRQGATYLPTCTNPAAQGFETLVPSVCFLGGDIGYEWDSYGPRIGLTYALGEERTTLLRASYARFADQLGGTGILAVHPLYYGPAYYTLAYDGNANGVIEPEENFFGLGPNAALAGRQADGTIAKSIDFQADPGLDAPTGDEVTLAVEHAFLPELVLGAQLVWRVNKDLTWEDLLVFDGNSIDDPEYGGRRAVRGDYVLYEVVDVTLPDGKVVQHPVYGLRDGVATRGGSYLYNSDREQEYLGLSLTANKRLTNQWSLRGNVTWSDWRWNIPSSAISDPNSEFWARGAYAGGNRDGDRVVVCASRRCMSSDWTANLTGLYQVAPDEPWGFNLAGSLNAREGYALPYFRTDDRPDLPAAQMVNLVPGRPDDYELDDLYTLDLRLEKELRFGSFGLTLGADCFNVLNAGTVLQRRLDARSASLDQVDEVLSPRIFRLGARISLH